MPRYARILSVATSRRLIKNNDFRCRIANINVSRLFDRNAQDIYSILLHYRLFHAAQTHYNGRFIIFIEK